MTFADEEQTGVGVAGPARRTRRTTRRSSHHATALVCRGCCCGTARKHPDVDHDRQIAAIEAAASPSVHVRATGCLGPCAHSNVVAVRLAGTTDRLWFGLLNTDVATDALVGWMRGGCRLPVPADLDHYQLGLSTEVRT